MILLVVGGNAAAVSTESTDFYVYSVSFSGAIPVPEKSLRAGLSEMPAPTWRIWSPLTRSGPEAVEDDVMLLKQVFQNHGYYNTTISYDIAPATPRLRLRRWITGRAQQRDGFDRDHAGLAAVHVTFTIDAGEPTEIAGINIDIRNDPNGALKTKVLDRLPLKRGRVFTRLDYKSSKDILGNLLQNAGYARAAVTFDVEVDRTRRTAGITITIDPGPQCVFGDVLITGTGDVQENLIGRALTFQPGDAYSAVAIAESRRNLADLDIFDRSLLIPDRGESAGNSVPITFEYKLKKRRNVQLGLGYGSEDGIRIDGSWTYRNVAGRGGKFRLKAERSDLKQGAYADYRQPYIINRHTNLRTRLGTEQETLESHRTERSFSDVTLKRTFRRFWQWTLGYGLEINRIRDLELIDPEEVNNFVRDNAFLISAVETGLERSTADDEINPRSGSEIAVTVQHASSFLGSELDFSQPALTIVRYQPLGKRMVLATRFNAKTISPTEDTDTIPIFRRLFLGGSSTVRGYGFQRLGPVDESGKPLGGLTAITGNIELRFPLYRAFSGTVFVDGGEVSEDAFSAHLDELRFTAGMGLRFNTVVGPLRFDYGYKLNPPIRSDFGLTQDPDGEIEDRWKIHLSIGHAF